jgi:hypothetical protein
LLAPPRTTQLLLLVAVKENVEASDELLKVQHLIAARIKALKQEFKVEKSLTPLWSQLGEDFVEH